MYSQKMRVTKMKYKGLSKDEVYLISKAEYESRKLITREFTFKLFNSSRKADNILSRLKKKGRLIQITRGKYIVVPLKAPDQLWSPNEFVTAKFWMEGAKYYIGYFTMYNYWGFTDQVPQTVYILNTKRSVTKNICNIRFKLVF